VRPTTEDFRLGDEVDLHIFDSSWTTGLVEAVAGEDGISVADGVAVLKDSLKVKTEGTHCKGSVWIAPGHIANKLRKKKKAPAVGDAVEFFSKTRKVWVIGKVLEVICRIQCKNNRAWIASATYAKKVRRQRTCYVPGDSVEVWSHSKMQWLRGRIEEVLAEETTYQGVKVPAGAVLVNGMGGVRWTMPPDAASHIRHLEFSLDVGDQVHFFVDSDNTWQAGTVAEVLVQIDTMNGSGESDWSYREVVRVLDPTLSRDHFAIGETVEVWSQSRKMWVLGIVEDIITQDLRINKTKVLSGSVRVLADTGRKWIKPEDVSSVLRHISSADTNQTVTVQASPN